MLIIHKPWNKSLFRYTDCYLYLSMKLFDEKDIYTSYGLIDTILKSGVITHQLPLKDYDQGFQALIKGQAIKVLLKPWNRILNF